MKFTILLCIFALVFALVSAAPTENTTPKWDLETCEERAVKARQESKVCRDYQCIQHAHGLVLDGIDCTHSKTD